ncbi:MAG TPA: ABC transporter ATP-binding protein [Methylomirabilota bacterium]|nr:ABC transporter ATP-binding protein [Methylomirabilota bacterium]
MTPALELLGVHKRYGTAVALEDASLTVPDGRLVFLLGPSGCGKTTTLRIVSGFVQPDRGEVRIGGARVDGLPPERRGLGMVFQHYALFPHLTVAENVGFGLRMRRVPAAEARRRVARALALVRLGGLESRLPGALSGGQQQRVALARAIVIEPRLLLLDEPLSSLDARLRAEMRGEIRAIQRALGIATLFVTHDQEEALTMADEIAVMAGGRVVQVGPPADLYDRPATRFVAEFLGDSNLERGTVTGPAGDGRWRVDCGGLALTAAAPRTWTPGSRVAVAVRPERVRVRRPGDPGPESPANTCPGVIEEVIFRGALRRYRVRLPHGSLWSVDEPAAGDVPAPLGAGAAVTLGWRPEDCAAIPDE